jgi:hypothetical protein
MAQLELKASGRLPTTIKIIATDAGGKVGRGTVKLRAAVGTLADLEVTLDAYGTATTTFTCDAATEPGCAGSLLITGEWSDVMARILISMEGATAEGDAGSPGWASTWDGGPPPCDPNSYSIIYGSGRAFGSGNVDVHGTWPSSTFALGPGPAPALVSTPFGDVYERRFVFGLPTTVTASVGTWATGSSPEEPSLLIYGSNPLICRLIGGFRVLTSSNGAAGVHGFSAIAQGYCEGEDAGTWSICVASPP